MAQTKGPRMADSNPFDGFVDVGRLASVIRNKTHSPPWDSGEIPIADSIPEAMALLLYDVHPDTPFSGWVEEDLRQLANRAGAAYKAVLIERQEARTRSASAKRGAATRRARRTAPKETDA